MEEPWEWDWFYELERRILEMQRRIFEDMHKMFERLYRFPPAAMERLEFRTPRIDMYEEDGELVVVAELPGVDKKDLEVYVEPDSIEIRARVKKEKEERGKNFYRREIVAGGFYRKIPLPVEIDVESASAKFENGILEIRAKIVRKGKGKKLEL